MPLSVGIFRARSQRPTQQAIRQKFVVPTKFVPPPGFEQPAVYAAISNQRAQFHLRRDPIGSIWRQRRPTIHGVFAPPADVETPGFLAATRKNRSQFGLRGRLPDQYWRQRRHLVLGAAAPPAAADIGWLVSWKIRRGYGHNLRR